MGYPDWLCGAGQDIPIGMTHFLCENLPFAEWETCGISQAAGRAKSGNPERFSPYKVSHFPSSALNNPDRASLRNPARDRIGIAGWVSSIVFVISEIVWSSHKTVNFYLW